MATINITPADIIRGESSADYLTDGGFSPSSYNLNLTLKRGHVSFVESPTDRGGATLTGNIVASDFDRRLAVLNVGNYFVDDEGAFYTLDGDSFSKTDTSDHQHDSNFQLGTTDMVSFKGNVYATTSEYVIQLSEELTISAVLADGEEWWSSMTNGYRHPLEVVEKKMFIGDGNIIYYWDGTTSAIGFTLPTENNITSLRKHPDGRTLLAFTGSRQDGSHNQKNIGKVYYCNPTLIGAAVDGWSREVPLEAQVEGTRLLGGVVYCTWGKKLGVFDGNGLVKLKDLETSETTYSHSMDNMEDVLVIRDGLNVLAYGDLGAGKVWWKPFRNISNSSHINNIHYKGDNKLLVAYSDGGSAGDLVEVDYDNQGILGQFLSNRYTFPSKTQMRGIDIIHDVSNSAGVSSFVLRSIDTEDTEKLIEYRIYTNVEATKSEFDYTETLDFFQFKLIPSQDTLAYKLFRIHYDPTK